MSSNSDVMKRCTCDESKQTKCRHPWYMKKFIWQGVAHQHSVTRWAAVHLNDPIATRTRADEVVEQMRSLIRTGQFTSAKAARRAKPKADPVQTLAQLVDAFDREVLSVRLVDVESCTEEELDNHRARLARLVGFKDYGARPVVDVDTAAIVGFRTSEAIRVLGRSSWAKYRGIYNRLFRYARRAGVITVHPLEDASEEQRAVLKRRKPTPRPRRLKPGEEGKLLAAALKGRFKFDAQRLHDLIVCALETAGRKGELLALQWRDVDVPTLPAIGVLTFTATLDGARKTNSRRTVPISARLRSVLVRRRLNPLTGQPFPDDAFVFGNETGERITQISAWVACVVQMRGQTPERKPGGNLSAASRAAYKDAGLHFHDLRREAASRWLDSGAFTLAEIRDLLGHTNIAQTSEYLSVKSGSAIDAMRRFNEQRAQLDAVPVAVGDASDCNATANGDGAEMPTPGPRLVKGRKSSDDR